MHILSTATFINLAVGLAVELGTAVTAAAIAGRESRDPRRRPAS